VEETEQIMEAGIQFGLKPKIHVNLLIDYGIQAGVKYKVFQ
jgi:imidazolonepropionase